MRNTGKTGLSQELQILLALFLRSRFCPGVASMYIATAQSLQIAHVEV